MESLNLFFVANFYLCPIGFSVKTIIVPDGDGKEFYFFFSIQEGLRVWKAGPDQHPVCISELTLVSRPAWNTSVPPLLCRT